MPVGDPRQDDVLRAELEQDPVQLLVVVDVLLALLALDPVERRLGDVDVALVEEAAHLAVEEREEERPDVRSVHVGVGHDDDLVVAGLLDVEGALALGVPDARPDGRDEGADFLVREHLVEPRLLGVDELAAQGKDRLVAPVAALLGGAAGRVALDDVELARGPGPAPSSRRACRAARRPRGPPCARSPAPSSPPRGPARRSASCR